MNRLFLLFHFAMTSLAAADAPVTLADDGRDYDVVAAARPEVIASAA